LTPITLTQLYVPADRPDRARKALAGEADAVILDLEDAVAPAAKDAARSVIPELVAEWTYPGIGAGRSTHFHLVKAVK
jgi:citrate lyase subunit beta/citryl-CoA lyase